MGKKLFSWILPLALSLSFSHNSFSQLIYEGLLPPDTDQVFRPNWQYCDYTVKYQMKLDSAWGGLQRPGYSPQDEDWVLEYCHDISYVHSKAQEMWSMTDTLTGLYNRWLPAGNFGVVKGWTVRAYAPPDVKWSYMVVLAFSMWNPSSVSEASGNSGLSVETGTFDMFGNRVVNPMTPGLYIRNGRKFIIIVIER